MEMPGQEFCRIVRRHRREGPVRERDYFWYEAVVVGPGGERTIARSQEWLHETQSLIEIEDAETIRRRNIQHDLDGRAEVVRALEADGWQVAEYNERGLPVTFRRSARSDVTMPSLDTAVLLRELEDLYRAGLLTSDEFEAKKAILRERMV